MNKFETIKKYYVKGLYTLENLDTFVLAAWITVEEKDEIIQYKNALEGVK